MKTRVHKTDEAVNNIKMYSKIVIVNEKSLRKPVEIITLEALFSYEW